MNKNIKKVIALALTISAFCTIAPATSLNIMTTKAYASDNDEEELSKLSLETSNGDTIRLYDDYDRDNRVDSDEVEKDNTYYAKSSSRKVQIDISGPSSRYVRIFKGTSSSTRGVKEGDDISLSSGTNILTVRVYSEEPDSRVRYDDDENKLSDYKIKVKYYGDDDIHLKSLDLSEGNISFSKSKYTYDVNVATSVDEVKITAKPDCDSDEYDYYEVRIDGSKVDEDDDFKKTVSLNKGKNEIKITVENEDEDDDDNKKTYTLNINRATSTVSNTPSNTPSNSAKTNQWIINSYGKWTYNNELGNTLKNVWFADRNSGKTYYLQADGSMAIGWLYKNGSWYYLGGNGEKQTGWTSISGNWYYLDNDGKMKTGWLRDWNGKWYYLQSSGAMAKNITIGGYKLGWDGAWIK